jgi:hypothetical protein
MESKFSIVNLPTSVTLRVSSFFPAENGSAAKSGSSSI